jgi:hypothetical protein
VELFQEELVELAAVLMERLTTVIPLAIMQALILAAVAVVDRTIQEQVMVAAMAVQAV